MIDIIARTTISHSFNARILDTKSGQTRPAPSSSPTSPPPPFHLIAGEGGLNSKLKSEGEDAKGKKAEEGSSDQDVDADVRQEKEVGKDEDADNSSETAQLGDLNNFASFLEKEKQFNKQVLANRTKPVLGPQRGRCPPLQQE